MIMNHATMMTVMEMGELRVVDVSSPTQPHLIGSFGMPNNNQGTWGVEVHQQQVYLTYIPVIFPFFRRE